MHVSAVPVESKNDGGLRAGRSGRRKNERDTLYAINRPFCRRRFSGKSGDSKPNTDEGNKRAHIHDQRIRTAHPPSSYAKVQMLRPIRISFGRWSQLVLFFCPPFS